MDLALSVLGWYLFPFSQFLKSSMNLSSGFSNTRFLCHHISKKSNSLSFEKSPEACGISFFYSWKCLVNCLIYEVHLIDSKVHIVLIRSV